MTIKLAYNKAEAAAACGVSIDTIVRAIHAGTLRAAKSSKHPETGEPTGRYIILAADLQAWLDGLAAA